MTKKDCVGCENNFYNGNNDLGVSECWSFDKKKKLISRKPVHIDDKPPWLNKPEKHPDCYHKRRWLFIDPKRKGW